MYIEGFANKLMGKVSAPRFRRYQAVHENAK